MRELVVTDLDGTLWDGSMEIHAETRRALGELDRRGIPVLAATGRRPRSAFAGLEANGIVLPGVMLDGTIGQYGTAGDRFHTAAFGGDIAGSVLEQFLGRDIRPCVFVDDPHLDVVLDPDASTSDVHRETMEQWLLERPLAEGVDDYTVLCFTVVGGERTQLDEMAAALEETGTVHVTVSNDSVYGGASLSALPSGANKWSGVVSYCEREGLDAANVLAMGDAANDVPMLKASATAVAVRSSSAEVLAAADHLIDRPEEGGWAAVLDLLG